MLRKNVSGQVVYFQGVDATTGGIKSGVTWTMRRGLDGTFAAGGGTVTEDGSTGWYKCALTQADTNGNDIGYNFTGSGAVPVTLTVFATACDPTTATNFGITALPATAVTTNASLLTSGTGTDQLSVTSGRIDVGKALGTAVTLDANNVLNVSAKYLGGTLQTGRDIGASVLLSAGSGAGQLDFTSGVVKANATQWLGGTIPAVNVTGVPLVDLKYTLGTISPATAGSVRADSVTGAVGSVTGAVGSVTGAVGSVTGAVGSVTGNVGGNVVGTVASVVGAVGSVTGLTASNLDTTVSSRLATSGYTAPPTSAQNATAVFTTQLTESYAALHAVPTLAQIMFEMRGLLAEKAVALTTLTIKKIDGSTNAETFTLSDATLPVSIARAT